MGNGEQEVISHLKAESISELEVMDDASEATGLNGSSSNEPNVLQRGQFIATQYQGPIPPPEMLRGYDRVVRGAANRIIVLFEKQTNHRISVEDRESRTESILAVFGLIFAFIIAMSGLVGSFVLLFMEKRAEGLTVFLSTLGAIVGAFIYKGKAEKKQTTKEDN